MHVMSTELNFEDTMAGSLKESKKMEDDLMKFYLHKSH